MTVRVISAPAAQAIATSLVKEHLRILGTDDDAALALYIPSAIEQFEAITGRCLIKQTITQEFDSFPDVDYFLLERGTPLIQLLHIKYYDTDNVLQTFAADNYLIASSTLPPTVCLNTNKWWPTDIHPTRLGSVQVTYEAGYGTADSSVPMDIKHALSLLVGDFFNNREDSVVMPGINASVKVHWPSYRFMQKYKVNFYQHASQSRK